MGITNYSDGDELSEWVFDNDIEKAKYFEKEYPGLFKVEGAMNEAKDEEVADEEVEVTDDFSMEEPQGPGGIDVTQNANADLTGTKKEVQDNLEAALEAARALGDEKLATQVGNTITFFNKQHVVKDTPVAENLNENIEFFEMDSEFEGAMEAGDQTEEEYLRDIIDTPSSQIDLSGYYEVENAIDQGDYSKGQAIKLMKSWAKDKMNELGLDESVNIKEILLLQKRAGIITETQYKQKLNEISEFENLEQDILDFWGVQQDDAAQSDGEYEAKWDNKFFIDEYPEHKGKEQEINSIVKKYKI
jgi:hypothetical protein